MTKSLEQILITRTRGKSLLPWFFKNNPEIAKQLKVKVITPNDFENKKLQGKEIKTTCMEELPKPPTK